MAISISNAAARAALDACVDLVDGGSAAGVVRIFAGSVPADADTALSGQTQLAELTMSDPAFGTSTDAAPGATVAANAVTDDSSADATGTATFFRCLDSNGNVIFQGTAGTSGTDMILDSASITAGQTVSITSITMTHPE